MAHLGCWSSGISRVALPECGDAGTNVGERERARTRSRGIEWNNNGRQAGADTRHNHALRWNGPVWDGRSFFHSVRSTYIQRRLLPLPLWCNRPRWVGIATQGMEEFPHHSEVAVAACAGERDLPRAELACPVPGLQNDVDRICDDHLSSAAILDRAGWGIAAQGGIVSAQTGMDMHCVPRPRSHDRAETGYDASGS